MTARKLKSVHITNYYHKNSGGISTVYNRLLAEANKNERQVRLIVPGERDEQETVGEFGRIYYVKASPAPIFDRRYRLLMPWQYMPRDSAIRNILLAEKPDIIEIAEKYTVSLLAGMIKKGYFRTLRRPMLVHLSCERMDDNLRAFVSGSRLVRFLAQRFTGNYIAPMFDYHFANSDYTASELLDAVEQNLGRSRNFFDFCWRFFNASDEKFSDRVYVTNCGVDERLFHVGRKDPEVRRRILTEAGFPENATVLLYVGRLSPEKNIRLLAGVLRSLTEFYTWDSAKHDYRLLVAGDGPQSAWLQRKLNKFAPGKFKLLGHIGDKEHLANLYANADVFLHPNPREPFGIAPLEAMASGTPVVAPNSGGVLSYANDENSWLEEPTVENYFAAVRDISNHPEKSRQKVANALETARHFTWEKSFSRLFHLYDELFDEFSNRQEAFELKPDFSGFETTHVQHDKPIRILSKNRL